MDELAGLLDGPRARGAFIVRAVMSSPWGLRVVDRAPITIVALVRGIAAISTENGSTVWLRPGDVAIARGPDPYTMADSPESEPTVVIHPGQICRSIEGEPMAEAMSLGVRTWGNDPAGSTVMLVGTYESIGEISERLVRELPALLKLAHAEWECPFLALLADEVVKDGPGQGAVLDRLLDLTLIAALRSWFTRPGVEPPAWYRAQADPIVGPLIRVMQNNPDHPWTVTELAERARVSRATLARRFTDLVGQPPMQFLTQWRLSLAADLLQEAGATVGSVAGRVGYDSPFAFSAAFKRVRGVSPKRHRELGSRDSTAG